MQPDENRSPVDQLQQLESRVSWLESMVFAQTVVLAVCFWWVIPAMFVLFIALLPILVFVHRFIPPVARWFGRMMSPVAELFSLIRR